MNSMLRAEIRKVVKASRCGALTAKGIWVALENGQFDGVTLAGIEAELREMRTSGDLSIVQIVLNRSSVTYWKTNAGSSDPLGIDVLKAIFVTVRVGATVSDLYYNLREKFPYTTTGAIRKVLLGLEQHGLVKRLSYGSIDQELWDITKDDAALAQASAVAEM